MFLFERSLLKIVVNGTLLSCKKAGNLTIWDSMDGPGKHYAKWNKPIRERQIPYDFTHVWNLMNKIETNT